MKTTKQSSGKLSIANSCVTPQYFDQQDQLPQYSENGELKDTLFLQLLNKKAPDPNVAQIISYLKLLHAFDELKRVITQNQSESDKIWQVYVTNAARRFIIYVSALKWKFFMNSRKEEFKNFMDQVLPPLDILMIWHTICLNPMPFLDNFKYNEFEEFLNQGMPSLESIEKAIDHNFLYSVSKDNEYRLIKMIEEYLDEIGLKTMNFKFDIYQPLKLEESEVPIYCQECYKLITIVELTRSDDTGFADNCFSTSKIMECKCSGENIITHDVLRRKQLMKDAQNPKILPSVFKYYSIPLGIIGIPGEVTMSNLLKKCIGTIEDCRSFNQMINYKKLKPYETFVFSDYFHMNLLSCTIPGKNKVVIREDLVARTIRLERFISEILEFKLFESANLEHILLNAIDRFSKFFKILGLCNGKMKYYPVAPLDIDLVWHVQLLNSLDYRKKCLQECRMFIDHADMYDEVMIHKLYQEMSKKYRKLYKEEFSGCGCEYCRKVMKSSYGTFTKKSNIDAIGFYKTIQHVSRHAAVEVELKDDKKLDMEFPGWRYDRGISVSMAVDANIVRKIDGISNGCFRKTMS